MFTYEVYTRDTNQHRHGHLSFLIDGLESEITVDPAQFAPKALRQAMAEGIVDAAQLAIRQEEICQQYAHRAIQRKIERLQAGTYGLKFQGGTASEVSGRRKQPEKQCVAEFLNRGTLKGLTKDDRKRRMEQRSQRYDHEADWHQRRAALLASRQADLKHWYSEQSKGNPKAERNIRLLEEEVERLSSKALAATHGFQYAYGQYWTEGVHLVNDDIRIVPLMTNTTVDAERDAKDQVSDFTTLDEFDGSGYATGGNALDNQAVNIDDANDRAEFDADDEVRTALGAGTRSIQGELLILFSVSLNASMPLHWLEYASNKTPDGSDFTVVINAEGLLNAQDG